MKINILDRLLLLATALLAAYQVMIGIEGLESLPTLAYTIAFGVLLVAVLLLMILGFEILDSPIVVVISTLLPLSLSLGLVWEHLESWRIPYLVFAVCGFLAILLTRSLRVPDRLRVLVLALVHGVAGMVVFLLPTILAAQGKTNPGFALVGLGGALIGLGGVLLSFLKAQRPIVSREIILRIFPALLLLTTAAFVAGFALQ
jgi:hypothetical protein